MCHQFGLKVTPTLAHPQNDRFGTPLIEQPPSWTQKQYKNVTYDISPNTGNRFEFTYVHFRPDFRESFSAVQKPPKKVAHRLDGWGTPRSVPGPSAATCHPTGPFAPPFPGPRGSGGPPAPVGPGGGHSHR